VSTLPEDPAVVDRLVGLTDRLLGRGAEVSSELTAGHFVPLRSQRIAIGVPHTVQRDAVRDGLDAAGITGVRVDTANRLQGLEFDVVLAWHPLAGLPTSDEWHLDPGRMCVLITRHRHACIVVGRADADSLLGTVPPPAETHLGTDLDPVTEGWFVSPGSGLGAATFHRGCLSGTRTAPALAEQRTASAPCFAERVRLFLDTTVAKSRSCNYGAGAMPIMFGG
jgi:hypothetical protein